MPATQEPLVSVGVPLYRARPFVERILENVKTVEYSNVEFLFADQHSLDDAADELARRLPPTVRARFFVSRDERPWFENYSFLAHQASGRYFRLLSQDDPMVGGSLTHAVEALEDAPDAVLACGPVEVVDENDNLLGSEGPSPHVAPSRTRRASIPHSLLLFSGAGYRTANLGLIRRSSYSGDGLLLPETHAHTGFSFRAWLFAVSLRGAICVVPGYVNRRCAHPGSFTSRHQGHSLRDRILILRSYRRATLALWRSAADSTLERHVVAPLLLTIASLAMPLLFAARRREKVREAEARKAQAQPQ